MTICAKCGSRGHDEAECFMTRATDSPGIRRGRMEGHGHHIGRHMATLNLFREPDGTLEITVADARGAMAELAAKGVGPRRPIDAIEDMILAAALRMHERHVRQRQPLHLITADLPTGQCPHLGGVYMLHGKPFCADCGQEIDTSDTGMAGPTEEEA